MNKSQQEEFYELASAVRRLFHKLGDGVAALHEDSAVSAGMRAVLETLVDSGPQTVPHMARVRPVTRQHIQVLVNSLIDEGLVEYIDNPAHKKSKLVCATQKGNQLFHAMRNRETHALRSLAVEPSSQDLVAATIVLKNLISAFEGQQWQSIIARHASTNEEK